MVKIKAYSVRVQTDVVVFATNIRDAKARAEALSLTTRGVDHEGIAEYAGYTVDAHATSTKLNPFHTAERWGITQDTCDDDQD